MVLAVPAIVESGGALDIVLGFAAIVIIVAVIVLWFWATAPGKALGGRLATWNALNRALMSGVLAPGADQNLWEKLLRRDRWMTVGMIAFFVIMCANQVQDAFVKTGWPVWFAVALAVFFALLAGAVVRRFHGGEKLRKQL